MSNNVTLLTSHGIQTLQAESGMLLSDIIHTSNYKIDMPCGGGGRCGKCRIKASGLLSPISAQEYALLSDSEIESGMRLACITKVVGDCTIYLSGIDEMVVQTTGYQGEYRFAPEIKLIPITCATGDLQNKADDVTMLFTTLEMAGYMVNKVTHSAVKKLPLILHNQKTTTVVLNGNEVIDIGAEKAIGIAIDIGTTTLAAYFYDLTNGALLYTASGVNQQREYGADVISRIDYCIENMDGLDTLQHAICGQLNLFINEFCHNFGVCNDNIYKLVIAGNTTMVHIVSGVNPANIAKAPFISGSMFGMDVSALDLGLSISKNVKIYLSPSMSSYVGGDITAGILACGLHKRAELCLLIDIGTNGEMALGNRDGFVACSTAAGPAFEGAHIKYGVGGITGAINSVIFDGSFTVTTIEKAAPIGICGSGIISAIAALLKSGLLDESGRIADTDEVDDELCKYIIKGDTGNEILIDKKSGITITQKDVREVQLAKAAIAAGIDTLLHSVGKNYSDLDKIFIAGGFGAHINKVSACEVGLLPIEIIDRIIFSGNSAGMGSVTALLDVDAIDDLEHIRVMSEYLELSSSPYFQDRYVEQMMFPG